MKKRSDLLKLLGGIGVIAFFIFGFWWRAKDKESHLESGARDLHIKHMAAGELDPRVLEQGSTSAPPPYIPPPKAPPTPEVVRDFAPSDLGKIKEMLFLSAQTRNKEQSEIVIRQSARFTNEDLLARIKSADQTTQARRLERVDECIQYLTSRMNSPMRDLEYQLIVALLGKGVSAPGAVLTQNENADPGEIRQAQRLRARVWAIDEPETLETTTLNGSKFYWLNPDDDLEAYLVDCLDHSYRWELKGLIRETRQGESTGRRSGNLNRSMANEQYTVAEEYIERARKAIARGRLSAGVQTARIEELRKALEARTTELLNLIEKGVL